MPKLKDKEPLPEPENNIYLYSAAKKIESDTLSEENDQEITSFLSTKLKTSLRSENIVVLTGAGSSIGFGGKSMTSLWDSVSTSLANFASILALVQYSTAQTESKDLELLLSYLQIHKQNLENKVEDTSVVVGFINQIENEILKECGFVLEDSAPHDIFLKKLLKARKNIDPRIKLFTLNYDTAFETAADRITAVLIDGFSFSQKQIFNPANYDLDIVYREKSRIHSEESFYSKVLHLYKIHGSVTWSKDADGFISKESKPLTDATKSVLIYPNSSKFEKSYEMPFFELVGRFQSILRKENTTLLVIGYGFNDEHINRILNQAIKSNTNLETYLINPSVNMNNKSVAEMKGWIDKGLNDLHIVALPFDNFVKRIPEVFFDDLDIRAKIERK